MPADAFEPILDAFDAALLIKFGHSHKRYEVLARQDL
jgi:hypothetical protein